MKHLAVIPARSGSKGIKDKNIKLLAGKPLMQYTLEAAKKAELFDCVHVSTDSEIYALMAKENGADVPFLRTDELATDFADTWGTVRYVLNQYRKAGTRFDMVTVLQPTSPLRNYSDILNAYDLFCQKNADAVISVCEVEHSMLLSNMIDETLSLDGFIDLSEAVRRQDSDVHYRVNGAIYMMRTCVLEKIADLYGKKSYAYIMPRERSVDIDSMLDFKLAELLIRD